MRQERLLAHAPVARAHAWAWRPDMIGSRIRAAALSLAVLAGCTACSDLRELLVGKPKPADARAWVVPVGQDGFGWDGQPAVHGGRVYIAGVTGLQAYRSSDGQFVWNSPMWEAHTGIVWNVAVANGRVCSASWSVIGCVDEQTGKLLWRLEPPPHLDYYETTLDDDTYYVGTREHRVVAYDASNGTERWATDVTPTAKYANRVFGVSRSGDTLYAATVHWINESGFQVQGEVIALDRRNGRELWRYETPAGARGGFQGAPAVAGRLIVMNDPYAHSLVAVDRFTGAEVWRTPVVDSSYVAAEHPPIIVGDTAFSGSTDTFVYAVDLRTGKVLWRTRRDYGSIWYLGVCGDRVIANNNGLLLVSRATRSPIEAEVPRIREGEFFTSGIASDGRYAFVASTAGLYAVRCS